MKTRFVVYLIVCVIVISQIPASVVAVTISPVVDNDQVKMKDNILSENKTLNTEESTSIDDTHEMQGESSSVEEETSTTTFEEETSSTTFEDKTDEIGKELHESEEKSVEIQTYTIATGKWGTVDWNFNDTTGILTFTSGGILGNYTSSPWNLKSIESSAIEKIIFTQSLKAPTNSEKLFTGVSNKDLVNLYSIEGLSYLDTSEVVNMDYMFSGMSSIKALDVSSFDTSNVTSMEGVFRQIPQLTSLDLSTFDTKKVINMKSMFQDSPALSALNISSFNTTNVTNMAYMFSFMPNLTSLDLSSFDTKQVIDMNSMFKNSAFSTLNISSFNTTNVRNMQSMFENTSNLSSLDLAHFDTSNVTNMSYLFAGTTSLKNLDISGFDTSKVTTMYAMFYGSNKLTNLDLSNFNTIKVRNMGYMFMNMSQLITLDIASFDMTIVSNKISMFDGLVNLSSLTLGEKFNDSDYITFLPDTSQSNLYSVYWRLKDGNTVGTSEQFMMNYDGSVPGTYTRELANDPLIPTDPTQNDLVLSRVPSEFKFSSTLYFEEYQLNQTLNSDEEISVINNRLIRDWSVKATIRNNQLTSGNNTLTIKQFTIDDTSLVGTGSTGIILKSEDQKSLDNNIGTIQKRVNNVSITFSDDNHVLKANSELKGVIQYQLYNTADAK